MTTIGTPHPPPHQWTADELRTARKAAGLTQFQLAIILNIQPGQIAKWEQGARGPDRWNCHQLTEVLGAFRPEQEG